MKRIETYTISEAYPEILDSGDIEIKGEGLLYMQADDTHGLQCTSNDNYIEIRTLCNLVARLIKDIDRLNNEQLEE